MQYAFDGIILLVVVMFTVIGVKKGFVKSIAEFLGAVISAIAASWVGGIISTAVYDSFFRQGVYDKIQAAATSTEAGGTAEKILNSMPEMIVKFLEMNGITAESIRTTVDTAGASAAKAVTDAVSPVFIGIIKVFAVIVLFLLFMIIISAVARLISGICRLPVLRQVNGLLGGIFGLMLGTIVVWIVVGAIQFFVPMMSQDIQKNVDTTVNNSYIAKVVANLNPIKWIFE